MGRHVVEQHPKRINVERNLADRQLRGSSKAQIEHKPRRTQSRDVTVVSGCHVKDNKRPSCVSVTSSAVDIRKRTMQLRSPAAINLGLPHESYCCRDTKSTN